MRNTTSVERDPRTVTVTSRKPSRSDRKAATVMQAAMELPAQRWQVDAFTTPGSDLHRY